MEATLSDQNPTWKGVSVQPNVPMAPAFAGLVHPGGSLLDGEDDPPNHSRSPRKISTNIHQRRYLLISIKEDIYKYPAKKISTNLPRSPPWCRWLKETLRALLSAASCSRRRSASPSKGETCLISIFIWVIFQSVTFNSSSLSQATLANLRRGGRRRGRHSWPRSQPISWCRPLGIKVNWRSRSRSLWF